MWVAFAHLIESLVLCSAQSSSFLSHTLTAMWTCKPTVTSIGDPSELSADPSTRQ